MRATQRMGTAFLRDVRCLRVVVKYAGHVNGGSYPTFGEMSTAWHLWRPFVVGNAYVGTDTLGVDDECFNAITRIKRQSIDHLASIHALANPFPPCPLDLYDDQNPAQPIFEISTIPLSASTLVSA